MNIHCKYDKLVKPSDLRPHPRNPNIHPKSQIELLSKVLSEHGWRAPIVVSKRSNLIIKGHGRLAAAKVAGFEKCPVEYQDYKTEDEENADLLADNKLAELSQADIGLVKALVEGFSDDFDVSLTGWGEDTFTEAIKEVSKKPIEPEYPITPKFDEKHNAIVITCNSQDDYIRIRDILDLDSEICYKSDKIGQTSVITGKRFIETIDSW